MAVGAARGPRRHRWRRRRLPARANDSSVFGNSSGNGAGLSTSAANATITAATALDPLGDGHEGDDVTHNAIHGNTATVWTRPSSTTTSPTAKSNGVGLALSLDREYDVTKVIVEAQEAGWGRCRST